MSNQIKQLICIENATPYTYSLSDQIGRQYPQIQANTYYYIKLFCSSTYTLTNTKASITFTIQLDMYGQLIQITPDNHVHLEIRDATHNPPVEIRPTRAGTRPPHRNKLLITPFNNVFARVPVPVIQYHFDRLT
jgi:hypothetical protein